MTRVVFRKYKEKYGGAVIAILPYWWNGQGGYLCSYMHIGQHGPCSSSIIGWTRLATPKEYAPLLRELRGQGYKDIVPVKRINYRTLKF